MGKGFQDTHLGEIQDQIEITPEELIEMRASEPVPNDEKKTYRKTIPGNKLTLDHQAEGFQLFKTAFDSF